MTTTVNWDLTNTVQAGDTSYSVGPAEFVLTPDSSWQAGLLTSTVQFDVDHDFTFSYDAYFGTKNSTGADGITWLMHNDPAGTGVTPGNAGWELGTTNIENAWALEFDTFDNSFDPSYDHIQLRGQSDAGGSHDFGYRFSNHAPLDATNVEDGIWHTTEIVWTASTRTLRVDFDGVTVGTYVFDVGDANGDGVSWSDFDTVLDGTDKVYFTLGGATGGSSNEHAVRNITMEGSICFQRGTLIRTPTGEVPVHKLREGDLIVTQDRGPQPIRWIGNSMARAEGVQAPVRFAPGTIGNRRALRVSPQHRIYVTGWKAEVLMGMDHCLVPALGFVNGTTVRQVEDGRPVEYWHLLFDQHEIIFAEGAATESFHPGPVALATLGPDQRREVLRLFPKLAQDAGAPALPSVPPRMARAFAPPPKPAARPLPRFI